MRVTVVQRSSPLQTSVALLVLLLAVVVVVQQQQLGFGVAGQTTPVTQPPPPAAGAPPPAAGAAPPAPAGPPIGKLGSPYTVYRALGLSRAGTFKALCDTADSVFVPGYGEIPLTPTSLMKMAQCNVGKPISCPVCQCFIDYLLEKLMAAYGVTIDRGSVEQMISGIDCDLFGADPFSAVCKDMTVEYKQVLLNGIMREASPYSICSNMGFCEAVGLDMAAMLEEESTLLQDPSPQPQLAGWKKKPLTTADISQPESESVRKARFAGEKAVLYLHVLKEAENKMERDGKEVLRKVDDMMDIVKASLKCPACRCMVYFTQDESEKHYQRTMSDLMGNLKGSTNDVVKTIAQYMVMLCDDLGLDPFKKVCTEKIRQNLDSVAIDILNGARAHAVCSRVGYCAAPGVHVDGDEGAAASIQAAARAALAATYR